MLRHSGMLSDFHDPFYPRREDLRIGFVAEVAWVYPWRGLGVGRCDVYGSSGQWVFETDQQRNLLGSFGWGAEEFRLVGALSDVETAAYDKSLEVGEGWVAELVDYYFLLGLFEGCFSEGVFADGGDGLFEFFGRDDGGVGYEAHSHSWAAVGAFAGLFVDFLLGFLVFFAVEGVETCYALCFLLGSSPYFLTKCARVWLLTF